AYTDSDFLSLDESTQRNLELVSNLHDGSKRFTLIEAVDFSQTSMGARRLKSWILRPLKEVEPIRRRHDQVELLYRSQLLLSGLRELLSGVLDLERLSARVALDRAHAKDLIAVRVSISRAFSIDERLKETQGIFQAIEPGRREVMASVGELLERAIDDDPSILLTEGRLIKAGYHEELDGIRDTRDNSKGILDAYLQEERTKTGIASLKIRYNRIIGYFFEVTKANLSSVPEHFIRRQSLVGAERFTTDRLIELETTLNNATDRIVELERELFLEVRAKVKEGLSQLMELAEYLATLDCLQSFAWAATVHGYTRPAISESPQLHIQGGRHPVVETTLPAGEFVPNDCALDSQKVSFALITGPNMAGKSTYLRQVALIVLMAQAGSFVPAADAEVGIVDRIFCRVGAQDNLARGESTFLVEMNETANILRSATMDSLIIMDEVGRGTGTNDGLSIAWAVSEHLIEVLSAKTLFATHYHELTDIRHPKLKNLSMEVLEKKNEVVFLKRVKEGPSENSYGIHVARLAGLPEIVVQRAREILATLVAQNPAPQGAPLEEAQGPQESGVPKDGHPAQTSLFSPTEMVCDEIVALDLQNTTPLDALNRIERWKRELNDKH
ncbi:MAG TPA: DNA mismatch repair protein MutS, partial [Spirochaetia bacterium]|nr:DNA mismatch repair protein MutS [Spirochaetia bacterium]